MDNLIWGIDQDGYELKEIEALDLGKTRSQIGRGLLDGYTSPAYTIISSLGGPIMELRPNHEFPGLFFTFAGTPSEPEALKGFISEHGLLTHPRSGEERIDYLIGHQEAFRQIVKAYDEGDLALADEFYEKNLQPNFRPHISRKNPTRHPLRFAPVDLLGLMCLQLGLYIAGQADFAQCAICGEPFRRIRTSRKTCSDACRKQLSRNKGD
jgi:hypothetical protein